MPRTIIETDYLIVGSGAVGMAFADTLFHETTVSMVIVDKHHGPGGHWNDAYSFVRLHQPSAFYGENSRKLGGDLRDTHPLNIGMCERATSAQIIDYYEQVMQEFTASTRVTYLPMSSYDFANAQGHFVTSQMTGNVTEIIVRKRIVDTTHLNTAVPSTHPPKYAVAPGLSCVPLNALPRVKVPPSGYVVVGAGKTGIDACLWLLENHVEPDAITWIMPRDSWFQNRANVQPSAEFFMQTFGALGTQMEAIVQATTFADLIANLEKHDQMLRLDPNVEPTMYHAAVVSQAELVALRQIKNVIRLGRVKRIEPEQIVLEKGAVAADAKRLYIDCSSSAAEYRPAVPVFNGNKITPQFVRAFQPTFSAAFIAYVEANYGDDAEKNQLCGVIPLPDAPITWLSMQGANMANQFRWGRDKELSKWILKSRLDGFTALSRSVDPTDEEKMAVLIRFRNAAMAAGMKIPVLLSKES